MSAARVPFGMSGLVLVALAMASAGSPAARAAEAPPATGAATGGTTGDTTAEGPAAGGAAALLSPQTLKEVAAEFPKEKLAELLNGKSKNIKLKYIEPDEPGGKDGWGVDYKWNVNKASQPSATPKDGERFAFGSMSYQLDIDGHYVFHDAENNQDLSTITAALKLERTDLGTLHVNAAAGVALQTCLQKIPFVGQEDKVRRAQYDLDSHQCQVDASVEELVRDGEPAMHYSVDFHASVEGNQNYSDTHTLFGLTGVYVYEPPSDSRANFFDAPFRLLRESFSGGVSKYGAPFPSLLLGVERVDAKDDTARKALTDQTTYTRANGEVAFNTIVANIDSQIVRFNVSYRYFYEFSAPDVIKAAGFDKFHFVTASLRFPARLLPLIESDDYELFVSYTSGRLPFNGSSDKAYEVGFATNIKVLADLLAR